MAKRVLEVDARQESRRVRCCRRKLETEAAAAAAESVEDGERASLGDALPEHSASASSVLVGSNPAQFIANQAASLRRGLAFVWLHYLYEPLFYRRRVQDAHRFLETKEGNASMASVQGAVQRAKSDPFHASFPSEPQGFLHPPPALRRMSTIRTRKLLPDSRAALRLALEARRTELVSQGSVAAAMLPELPDRKHYFTRAPLEIQRSAVFDSAVEPLLAASPAQLLAGVHVRFLSDDAIAESGVDSGGLSRELFDLGLREIIAAADEEYTLPGRRRSSRDLGRAASSSSSALPRSGSSFESIDGCFEPMFREQADMALMLIPSKRPLAVYHALGRFLAVCLVHASYGDAALPSPLNDCLLKYFVGVPITAADVRRRDPIYYRNRIDLLLKPGGIEMTAAALCLDNLVFVEECVELVPGGASKVVTSENVEEYARLLSEEYVCGDIRQELAAMLAGFHAVVPERLLKECGIAFSTLGMLLSGVAEVDVASWRKHSEVRAAGVSKEVAACVADCFWEVLMGWPQEELSTLLAFSSGCSRLPAVGFAGLEPLFCLEVVHSSERLPAAHTCFNCITLPAYRSKDVLAEKLSVAIHESSGFGLV